MQVNCSLSQQGQKDAILLDQHNCGKPANFKISEAAFAVDPELSDTDNEQETDCSLPVFQNKATSVFGVYCQSHAQNFNGDFVNKLAEKELYLFLCDMGHKFALTKKQVIAGKWCNNCAKSLENINRFVHERKGTLLSTSLSKAVRIQCENGHIWEANFKKACLKWCKECSKTSKRLLKEMIHLENKRIEEEKRIHQVG